MSTTPPRSMKARWPGFCGRCGQPTRIGDRITRHAAGRWLCITCAVAVAIAKRQHASQQGGEL